ncbi:hypothetical protein [Erythrobacter sp. R86502]|uniref:hypothetical protein n=1 Tax=Erythrobacter sp. R86502 TaxID=3093846 RepID=UPI0036D3B1DB
MTLRRKSRARGLIALAIKLAPSDRKIWFEAMAAEIHHVPDLQRTSFAAGCVVAAVRERLFSPLFVQSAARSILVMAAMGWAAMNIRFAGRMSVTAASGLEGFAYLMAFVFVVGAFATVRFGHRATIALAAPFMALLAVAAVTIRLGAASAPVSDLYVALIVEDLAILMAAVMMAMVADRLIRHQRKFV